MTDGKTDRRCTRRHHRLEDHGIVRARVRPGYDVSVVDLSAGGALIESRHRLLPGSSVELHLHCADRRAAVRGRVLRCMVSRLRSTAVCYRGAIGFDRHLPWFVDGESLGYAVPAGESRPARPCRAEPTLHVL